MPTLSIEIKRLAHAFAVGVVSAIQTASLDEILEGGPGKPAARRGPGRPRKVQGGPSVGSPKAPRPAPHATRTATQKTATKTGRLARRSPSDIEHVIGLVVGALREHKGGLRSEQLQKVLKLSKKEVVRPLAEALAKKRITKKGQKRATTYFAR